MGDHLTKEHLKKLTSYIRYSNFEHGQIGCEYIPFYINIKSEIQDRYPNLQIISEKILKALCYIYNKKKNYQDNFDNELCSYLYYWLGDKIYPIVQDKGVFSSIINMIYGELYSNIRENFVICKYPNTSIELDTFIQNKLLFDYSNDYGNIKIDTAHGETTCDADYKEYIVKYISIYKDAYSKCTVNSNRKYECNKYLEILNERLYPELSTFNCVQRENSAETLEVRREAEEQKTSIVEDLSHDRVRPPSTHHLALRNISLDSHRKSDGQEDQGRIELPLFDDTSRSSSSKTIAGSVVPVLGVSSFSLLLYKVTPVGGYINRLLGRNRNVYNNIEYMDAFNPYSDGMIPGDRRMNISYHRL